MIKNSSGVQFNDRVLAGKLRSLTMEECMKHLKKGKGKMYEAVLLKLSGSVLPRLQEVGGMDGEPIKLSFDPVFNNNG